MSTLHRNTVSRHQVLLLVLLLSALVMAAMAVLWPDFGREMQFPVTAALGVVTIVSAGLAMQYFYSGRRERTFPDDPLLHRLRRVMDAAIQPMIIFDEAGQIRYANFALTQTMGLSSVRLTELKIFDLIAEPDRERIRHYFQEYLRSRQKRLDWTNIETLIRRPGGKDFSARIQLNEYVAGNRILFTAHISELEVNPARYNGRSSIGADWYQTAINHSNDAFFILEAVFHPGRQDIISDFIITDLNQAAERMFRSSRDRMLGLNWSIIADGTKSSYFRQIFTQVYQSQRSREEELSPEHLKDTQWLNFQVIPLPHGVAVMLRDISHLKQNEEDLRKVGDQYQLLFEGNPFPMWVVRSSDQKIIAANEAAINHYGYTWDQFMSMTLSDLCTSDEEFAETPLLAGTSPETICNAHKLANGQHIHVELTYSPIIFEGIHAKLVMAIDMTDRIRAQAALARSEAGLNSLVENTDEAIWALDKDCRLTMMNSAFIAVCQSLFNTTPAIGDYLPDLLPPNIAESFVQGAFEPAIKGESQHLERQFDTKDGTISFEVHVNPIRTGQEITGISLFARDITERKSVDNALSNMAAGVSASTGTEFLRLLVQYLCSTLGTDQAYVGRVDRAEHRMNTLAYFSEGQIRNNYSFDISGTPCEYVVLTRNTTSYPTGAGELFPGSSDFSRMEVEGYIGTPLINSRNETIGIITVLSRKPLLQPKLSEYIIRIFAARAVSELERLEAEEATLHSEERYRSLVLNMHEGVLYLNQDHQIAFANPRLYEMLGYTGDGIGAGDGVNALLHPAKNSAQVLSNLFQNGESLVNQEIQFIRGDKRLMWGMVNTRAQYNPDGQPAGWLATFTDITELKTTEERLKTSNQDLNTFVYRSSHDLKGPLASIMGLTDLAMKDISDETSTMYIKMIRQGAQRLDKILSDLLETIQIKEGTVSLSDVDLKPLVEEVLNSMAFTRNYEKLEVRSRIELSKPLRTDRKILMSVLQNLIDNAIKYHDWNKPQPFIHISACETETGSVRIEVEDNGMGIIAEAQDKIFNMFYRASLTSKGTGLGLYIVKGAVEKLGGTISLVSSEGAGTKFILDFPAA